jgi:hypothetical protein
MDQSVSIAHVGDGDNASCLGHKDLPVLFQETQRWDDEHSRLRYDQPVVLSLYSGGQIDYGDYA